MRLAPPLIDAMIAWRHALHAHPETAFEEHRTSARVAEILRGIDGLAVHTGLAGTGVVATLQGALPDDGRAIGLRADLDALHLHEANDFEHASQRPGKMHACGHDGHTAMLLGAAQALAAEPNFAGRVHFIFQPAEENEGGARVMIEQGLFEQFPCDAVYGLHNWPGLPEGHIYPRVGASMAAFDRFEITITGQGAHAARPQDGVDAVVIAAQVVLALQTIASRTTAPVEAVVVSVTQINAGDTWNVLPESVVLRGTTRCLSPTIHASLPGRMRTIVEGICAAHGATAAMDYEACYPVLVNTPAETTLAAQAARAVVGAAAVHLDPPPSMGAEDFAFMLQQVPGCYVWLGAGDTAPLHTPRYDFNDRLLATGCQYWVTLAQTVLAQAAPHE
jgi:hippurate hydrolase